MSSPSTSVIKSLNDRKQSILAMHTDTEIDFLMYKYKFISNLQRYFGCRSMNVIAISNSHSVLVIYIPIAWGIPVTYYGSVLSCTIEKRKVCFLTIIFIKKKKKILHFKLVKSLCCGCSLVQWFLCSHFYNIEKLYIPIFKKGQKSSCKQTVSITLVPRTIIEQALF